MMMEINPNDVGESRCEKAPRIPLPYDAKIVPLSRDSVIATWAG